MSKELVFCAYLNIISRFELAVHHVILLHAHKCGIGIGFRITISLA